MMTDSVMFQWYSKQVQWEESTWLKFKHSANLYFSI